MHLSGGRPVDEVIGLFWELHARLLWEVGEQTRAVVVENKQFVERAEISAPWSERRSKSKSYSTLQHI